VAPARYLPRSPPNYWRGPPSLMGGGRRPNQGRESKVSTPSRKVS